MIKKQLNARGKGQYTYDYDNDILLFKTKDRDYAISIEYGNIVFDVDSEGFITGLQIFDASKILKIPKMSLKDIKNFELNVEVEDKVITAQLKFVCEIRNKEVMVGQDFVRESASTHIKNSEVVCTV